MMSPKQDAWGSLLTPSFPGTSTQSTSVNPLERNGNRSWYETSSGSNALAPGEQPSRDEMSLIQTSGHLISNEVEKLDCHGWDDKASYDLLLENVQIRSLK